MDEKELLEIIEQAAKDGRTELNLSHKEITSLPPEIGKLTKLQRLNLWKNQIVSLPPEIGKLKNLTTLNLFENQLSSLPPDIWNLKKLTILNIGGNLLNSLPPEIGNLKNLTFLMLSKNQLSKLPTGIVGLENLSRLHLAENQLTDITAIMDLTMLKRLDLSRNRISELPKKIVNLDIEIKWEWEFDEDGSFPLEDGLFLAGNPLESPPIEIVKQSTEAVRNYFKAFETQRISHLYEAKLLIVGDGGVGKTCLMKRLLEPDKELDVKKITTEGIDINQWVIGTDKTKDLRVNFWDFGGQEIYHATHQFFFTKRSLYLFVWVARTDDDLTSFDYWLNVVKLLSNNSPVIVVLNKIDERIKTIDEQSLKGKFENIKYFDRVSALQGTGIKDLAENIKQQIGQLPHIGDVLPTAWVDIRKQLEELDKNYISFDEYKEICSEFGLDEERAEFLSQYYHDLGVFLHFLDNAVLSEIVFLKPDWATNAVYKVVDTREIQENHGKFHFKMLEGIWSDYPKDTFAHLLELMKKFELCFQIPNTQTYILPELLRPGRPELNWDYTDNLRFEYRYEFMPAGIITRFIVRTHDICKEDIYWKNGVILEREKTEALVIRKRLNRKISIWIRGDNRKELLAIIRREIDYIHKTLNYPDVKEMIPCICSQCVTAEQPNFYDYQTLRRFRAKGKGTIACEKSIEDISIPRLLGDYERKKELGDLIPLEGKTPRGIQVTQLEISIDQKLSSDNLITYSNKSPFRRWGQIPYYYGAYIQDRTQFFGREEEKREILNLIEQAWHKKYWHIAVIGDYRSGKSSLLKVIEDEIQITNRSVSAYIDLSSTDQDVFFQSVISAVGEIVFAKSKNSTLVRKFKNAIYTKRIDAISDLGLEADILKVLKIKLGLRSAKAWLLFQKTLNALYKKLREYGNFSSIVIILDEITAITTWEKPKVILKQLRSLAQSTEGFNIIVGSAYPLYQLTKDEWSPFFNIFRSIRLNQLNQNEAEELITKPGSNVGLRFHKELIERIHSLSGDRPYYIQVICSEICQRLLKMGTETKIDEDFVNLCIDDSIDRLRDHFLSLWDKTTSYQKEILSKCAESPSKSHKIALNNMSKEQKKEFMLLSDRGLIVREEDEVKICGLLSRWITNYT